MYIDLLQITFSLNLPQEELVKHQHLFQLSHLVVKTQSYNEGQTKKDLKGRLLDLLGNGNDELVILFMMMMTLIIL